MKTTLDRFGRLVIPKDIRGRLGLRQGVEIEIEEQANVVVLRLVEHEPTLKLKKGILVYSGEAIGDRRWAVRTRRESRVLEEISIVTKKAV